MSIFVLSVAGYYGLRAYGETISLDKLRSLQTSSLMMDRDGKFAAKLSNVDREFIPLKDLEKHNSLLVNTIVAVEDKRFFEYDAVDAWSVCRALWANVKRGKYVQGFSGLTMQVARVGILENYDKTLGRKTKELGTALNLSKEFSHREILECYLTIAPFCPAGVGVQKAARLYTDKDLKKTPLEIHEVALIAGMPQAPWRNDPFSGNPEFARQRRDHVLDVMLREGLINETEAEKAKAKPLTSTEAGKKHVKSCSDDMVAYQKRVLWELQEDFDLDAAKLSAGEYIVHTAMDSRLQKEAERLLSDKLNKCKDDINGGSATLEAQTGAILSIAGGRDHNQGMVRRPTGSVIKPLTVFAPAIENGCNEATLVNDAKLSNSNVNNFDNREHGSVPMMDIVKNSYNLGTLRLLRDKVTLRKSQQTGSSLGLRIPESGDDFSEAAMGLGGFREIGGGVSPLEMAQAYTVFPCDGVVQEAFAVIKVELPDGSVISRNNRKPQRVFSTETARRMNFMLQRVITEGTGRGAELAGGRPVAGKTGTHNRNHESWMAEYTAGEHGRVTVVMMYSNRSMANNTGSDFLREKVEARYPKLTCKEIMNAAHLGVPMSSFVLPRELFELPGTLSTLQLDGRFDPQTNGITLAWSKQNEGVSYELYRNGMQIASLPPGTNAYTDIIALDADVVNYELIASDKTTGQTKAVTKNIALRADGFGGANNPNAPNGANPFRGPQQNAPGARNGRNAGGPPAAAPPAPGARPGAVPAPVAEAADARARRRR